MVKDDLSTGKEMKVVRTTSENEDFRTLVTALDHELAIRDGDEHAFYSQFNKLDTIRHAVVASVRHEDTDYDALLMKGVPRQEARDRIWQRIDQVLTSWS